MKLLLFFINNICICCFPQYSFFDIVRNPQDRFVLNTYLFRHELLAMLRLKIELKNEQSDARQ